MESNANAAQQGVCGNARGAAHKGYTKWGAYRIHILQSKNEDTSKIYNSFLKELEAYVCKSVSL